MIKQTIICATCNAHYTESKEGDGFPGWGALKGIVLDGEDNPHLCPSCLSIVASYVDQMKKGN